MFNVGDRATRKKTETSPIPYWVEETGSLKEAAPILGLNLRLPLAQNHQGKDQMRKEAQAFAENRPTLPGAEWAAPQHRR